MPSANPLAIFAPPLNATGVPWMAVGSIASNAYGEARMTLDLDVVMVIPADGAPRFVAAFRNRWVQKNVYEGSTPLERIFWTLVVLLPSGRRGSD